MTSSLIVGAGQKQATVTFTMFSGTWNGRGYLEVPYFEFPAARDHIATGLPELPAQPPVLRTSEKIPDRVSEAGEGWGQHGMRTGTVLACTPSRAPAVLLGNVVLCGMRRRGLSDKGLRFPSVLRKLCAARLRGVGDDAAIEACFALGPMLASVPGRSALPWGGWGAGR